MSRYTFWILCSRSLLLKLKQLRHSDGLVTAPGCIRLAHYGSWDRLWPPCNPKFDKSGGGGKGWMFRMISFLLGKLFLLSWGWFSCFEVRATNSVSSTAGGVKLPSRREHWPAPELKSWTVDDTVSNKMDFSHLREINSGLSLCPIYPQSQSTSSDWQPRPPAILPHKILNFFHLLLFWLVILYYGVTLWHLTFWGYELLAVCCLPACCRRTLCFSEQRDRGVDLHKSNVCEIVKALIQRYQTHFTWWGT